MSELHKMLTGAVCARSRIAFEHTVDKFEVGLSLFNSKSPPLPGVFSFGNYGTYDKIFSSCIIDSVGTPSLVSFISDIKFNDLSVEGLSEVVTKLLGLMLLNKSPPDWPSKLTSLELSNQDIGCAFTYLIKSLAKYALPFLLRCNFF